MHNLKRLRQWLNLTIPQLAVYSGVSPTTALNAERNPGMTRSATLGQITLYLQKRTQELGFNGLRMEHLIDVEPLPDAIRMAMGESIEEETDGSGSASGASGHAAAADEAGGNGDE